MATLTYHVRIFPSHGRSGFLMNCGLAPTRSPGTEYNSFYHAKKSAQGWLTEHPEGRYQIEIFRTGVVRQK